MARGSCLCGAIRFEIDSFVGPFELCHCSRCRKASGSAFVAGIGFRARDFRWIAGADDVRPFEAPVREHAPGYRTTFCRHCGSPAPDVPESPAKEPGGDWCELPAGLLDDDPGLRPDRHIFIECGSTWYAIVDSLPRSTKEEVIAMRKAEWKEGRGRWSPF